ncbi:FxsA family protein [Angustibacter peucedani]
MSARTTGGRPRGRRLLAVLVVLLLVVPTLEIAVIVAVGRAIGGWPTLGLLLVESALGAWLVRREGSRAWAALVQALQTGRMPARELSDAALVLVGGTLLLAPGFLTDVAGFACVLPVSRPLARRALAGLVERRLLRAAGPGARWPGSPSGPVVPGTVVDDEPPRPGDDGAGRTS